MPYILSISVGPVQDFIAAARKTRDLWFGSYVLSEVSRAVADSVAKRGKLVFPHDVQVVAVPNKLLAFVVKGDPAAIAEEAKQAAVDRLKAFKDDALKQLNGVKINDALLNKQLDSFLEFYAAWWPLGDGDKAYSEARLNAERLLAGRKALRDFSPAFGADGVPKSSLDGGREAVLKADDLKPNERVRLGIKRGECLDGISLIKRLAKAPRFVSVSRIAADPLIRRIGQSDSDKLVELIELAKQLQGTDLIRCFDKSGPPEFQAFPYDTQLFYTDAAADKDASENDKGKAAEFHRRVRDICRELDIREPTPYFAVIAADGDRMGKIINELGEKAQHIDLSDKMAAFATAADGIVAESHGAMVYCGGDDVLAFLPLDTALDCADKLRKAFKAALADFGDTSLSCGVSIAHFGEHLQDLIQWARNAEHAAKDKGRNSLAVHLHTRTAGDDFVESVSSWADDPVVSRWARWIQLYETGLPKSATYDLRILQREFRGLDTTVCSDLLEREVRRVLGHKREQTDKKLTEELVKELVGLVANDVDNLDRLVNELIIARHLVKAKQIVCGKPEGVVSNE